MHANDSSRADSLGKLAAAIDDALDLLKDLPVIRELASVSDQAPGSLLDQCISLCAQQQVSISEPIRTVHHFACTGGTLISKCLAAMPNIQLISEVDPLSTPQKQSGKPLFAPTDIATLARQSTRGTSQGLIIEFFLSSLSLLYSETTLAGQRLILRDHSHSHFCTGAAVPERPSLRALVVSRFPVLSIITVRHPLDSYMSLRTNNWVQFSPSSFDEYCNRYIAFLECYQDVPVVRYEDFVGAPQDVMKTICRLLDIPFSDQFIELFDVFDLTGDSGRRGAAIEPRHRRSVDDSTADELGRSFSYRNLLDRLNYPEDEIAR